MILDIRSVLTAWRARRAGSTAIDAWTGQVDPVGAESIPPYVDGFVRCAQVSQALGAPAMALSASQWQDVGLSDRVGIALGAAGVQRDRHDQGMPLQCLKWSNFLAPAIARATGLQAWPTLGQLWKDDVRVFGPSWDRLRSMWEEGVHLRDLYVDGSQGLDWHAWITLESGEIVDPTILSSLAVFHPKTYGDVFGGVACGAPDVMFPPHRYFPMLAGAALFETLQAKSSLPLLARHVDELAIHDGMPGIAVLG